MPFFTSLTFTLSLNCFLLGDDSTKFFTVKVPKSDNVSILKEMIKEKKACHLAHLDASDLILWKLRTPIPLSRRNSTSAEITERIRAVQTHLPVEAVEGNDRVQLLDAVEDVSDYWDNSPQPKHLHILVQKPAEKQPDHDPTQLLSLNCLFFKDDSTKVFTVKIFMTDNVSILKKLIKEERAHHLAHLDASDLTLYKVSLSTADVDSRPKVANTDSKGKSSMTRIHLQPLEELKEVFPEPLQKNHVHIIVEHGPEGASSSTNMAVAPHCATPPSRQFGKTESTASDTSAHPGNPEHKSEFPWSVTHGPKLDVTFERSFVHHEAEVRCVKFSLDGKYVAVGVERWDVLSVGGVIFYSTETREQTSRLVEHTGNGSHVRSMCFSPNDRLLAVGHFEGHVNVWLIARKRIRNMFRHHRYLSDVVDLDFSPDGRSIVSSGGSILRISNVRDGSSTVLNGEKRTISYESNKFSPNGRYVAAGDDRGFLRIWDSRTGQLVGKWGGRREAVESLAFTPDGKGLVSGSMDWTGTIKHGRFTTLGDNQSAKDTVTFEALFPVASIAITADGQWLLSGSHDCTARLWNISNGAQQCALHGHSSFVASVDISRVGNYLAIGDDVGEVSLWRYKAIGI